MSDVAPLILMSAPNGARLTKRDHPGLPITPEELADCAEQLVSQGVSVLHLHVRDEDGRHSLEPHHYRPALDAIKARVGDKLIIQITTEAVGIYERQRQMEIVRELQPEAVSLALRELCPEQHVEEACEFFAELHEQGCWAQYILYDVEDVKRFEALRKAGRLGRKDPFALFVIGRHSAHLQGNPEDLHEFLAHCDHHEFPWAMCCFGVTEADAAMLACQHGGHLRIGFENNRWLFTSVQARDNHELINRTLAKPEIGKSGRALATADDVRALFIRRE